MRPAGLSALLLLLVLGSGAIAEEHPTAEEQPIAEPPGGLPAEEALDEILPAWLLEGDAPHAAWAAWIAAERRCASLVPLIRARLVREAHASVPRPSPHLAAVLLDALIRFEAAAPSGTPALARLVEDHGAAVATLLCRQHAASRAHLVVFDELETRDDRDAYLAWLAVGNFLARWGVPSFKARVLAGCQIERRVRVWDAKPLVPYPPPHRTPPPPRARTRCVVPEGFPPVARYALSVDRHAATTGTTPLADGGRRVYVRRVVSPDALARFETPPDPPDPRHARRYEWLCNWLGRTRRVDLPPWDTIEVRWTGGKQAWDRTSMRAIEELHSHFRQWRDALFPNGQLTDNLRRSVTPKIVLVVNDERRDRRRPLPPLPKVPFDSRIARARPGPLPDAY